MPGKSQPQNATNTLMRDILQRLEVLERRMLRAPRRDTAPGISELILRWNIIDEERLRGEIARDEILRRKHPGEWRRRERERVAENRAAADLNRRLRAAGLKPQPMRLSLTQKMKKLQHLEAANRAETETCR